MKFHVLRGGCALAVALALLPSVSFSQSVFNDDFESYANQAAFDASWNTTLAATLTLTSTNRSFSSGSNSIFQGATAASCYKAYSSVWSTNIYYRTYFFDAGASRSFSRIESHVGNLISGGLNQQLVIGRYNTITGNKYYGRQVNGKPAAPSEGGSAFDANGFFLLNGAANTSAGWHKAEIVGGRNSSGAIRYRWYIDGVLGGSSTDSLNREFALTLHGSGLSLTGTGQWFDSTVIEALQMVPQIATQPTNQTVNELTPVLLAVVATNSATTNVYGVNTLKYQWQWNSADLVGATSNVFVIASCRTTNSGYYKCLVTDAYGSQSTASDEIYLQVDAIPIPVIDASPASQIANPHDNVTFSVTAHTGGGATLYYTWRFYGTNFAFTGTDNNLYLNDVLASNTGPYTVVVTNDIPGSTSATSTVATLTVNLPPTLTSATNQTVAVNTKVALRMRATDDLSSESLLFQTFDTNSPGAHVMFNYASFSGTSSSTIDTNSGVANFTIVTNNFPDGHGGPRVLTARWTWLSASPGLRFTTATSGGILSGAPIISYTNRLRFDVYSDRDLQVGLGFRDANPTGALGSSDTNTAGQIEWVGVSASTPTRTVSASTWTTLDFDPLTDPIQNAYGVGNGILESTTGKGTLEHLYLKPADGQPNPYTMYVDNFLIVAANRIAFTMENSPADATIDEYSGIITWAPTSLGPTNFTVIATDSGGLSTTNTFTVTVVIPPATIVLNTPTNNASFTAPATVPLSATVTANGNTIDYVGFYNGSTWVYVTNAPYSTNLTGVAVGTYPISAQVHFNGASTANSATNTITVINNTPPTISGITSDGLGAVHIAGTGAAGQTFVLVKSTNVSLSIASWTRVATNNTGAGSFNFPVTIGSTPAAFFKVLSQ